MNCSVHPEPVLAGAAYTTIATGVERPALLVFVLALSLVLVFARVLVFVFVFVLVRVLVFVFVFVRVLVLVGVRILVFVRGFVRDLVFARVGVRDLGFGFRFKLRRGRLGRLGMRMKLLSCGEIR